MLLDFAGVAMEKKLILFGLAVFAFLVFLVAVAGVFIYLSASQIECSTNTDCLDKHYKKCVPYETTMTGSEAIVDFESNVVSKVKILGERDGACGLQFNFQSATNTKDEWAVGKTLTCYVSEMRLRRGNPLDVLENDCEGDFVPEALSRCKITGSSNTSSGDEKPVATCA